MLRQIRISILVSFFAFFVILWFSGNLSWGEGSLTPTTEEFVKIPLADGFDFPVNPPNAKKYYNAQPFGENFHLGEDWNGIGGGDSDLGDPVYSIGDGMVSFARDMKGGWGNVVRIVHRVKIDGKIQVIESLYAHLDTILLQKGDMISRGTQLGTIGTANGQYKAHLHLEIRREPDLPLGPGYSKNVEKHFAPTEIILSNRPLN